MEEGWRGESLEKRRKEVTLSHDQTKQQTKYQMYFAKVGTMTVESSIISMVVTVNMLHKQSFMPLTISDGCTFDKCKTLLFLFCYAADASWQE